MTPEFRRDIEIARGAAIIGVFFYHLLPVSLPAGFLGVDIFFVLSGYLMSGVYRQGAPGALREYLLRRGRRILPAYFTTIVAVLLVSLVVTLPHEFADVVRHAEFSALLIPNIGYWLDGSYFDKAAFRPALHLWSLGVELQFYIVVPLIAFLVRRRPLALAALALASLAACLAVVEIRPRYAFFLTPFRLWEFILGYAAHQAVQRIPAGRMAGLQGAACALALCVIALMFFPVPETSHPKFQALFVTTVTAAILVAGFPRRLMSSLFGRGMMQLGKYSYSIYLVHFPVIAFWFYEPFGSGRPVSAAGGDIAAVIALTVGLSLLLFHFIEAPFRAMADLRKASYASAAMAGSLLVACAIAQPLQRFFVSGEVLAISDAWFDRGAERCGKFALLEGAFRSTCALNAPSADPARRFLLVGDSHADAMKEAMAEVATAENAELRLYRENCTIGVGACAVDELAAVVADERISTIIVHAMHANMRPSEIERLVATGREQGFDAVIIDPVPVWAGSIPEALYDTQQGLPPAPWLVQTLDAYRASNAALLADLDRIAAIGVTRFSPAESLCNPDCVYVSADGHALYFDAGHLTISGARRLKPIFERIFDAHDSGSPSRKAAVDSSLTVAEPVASR